MQLVKLLCAFLFTALVGSFRAYCPHYTSPIGGLLKMEEFLYVLFVMVILEFGSGTPHLESGRGDQFGSLNKPSAISTNVGDYT